MTHKFYKENSIWYIDLPEFLEEGMGSKANLMMVDGADIGTASLGQPGKWSFTTPNLTPGNHSISAVVVRKSDGIKGTPSAGYGITVR